MFDIKARAAAADHFAEEMEECPWCHEFVYWVDLEALIGTPPVCPRCQRRHKERLLADAMEQATWPLGLS